MKSRSSYILTTEISFFHQIDPVKRITSMKKLSIIFVLFLLVIGIQNQTSAQNILKPILLDKSTLSGIGLDKVSLNAEPEREFFQKRLLRGDDISVYVVSSQSWTTRMDNFAIDEVVFMLNGKALITPDQGQKMEFQSNEFFFIPKGYTGKWQIQANDSYHYELSVISTQRAPKPDPNKTLPELLDKDAISGVQIALDASGDYKKVLAKGNELTVSLNAEKPKEIKFSEPAKERLIYVLSGQVVITDNEDSEYTFHTGDFFVLPKGFIGKWNSQGHGLFKSLVVEKTV